MAIPRSQLRMVAERMREAGEEMPLFENLEDMGAPEEHIHLVVDVADTYDAKLRSLNSHATQMNPRSPWRLLPEDEVRAFFTREYFTQVHPDPNPRVEGTATEVLFGADPGA